MQIFNYKSPWHQSKSQKFLIWLVKVFSKIRTSFSKSLKGKERLSVVFWGWVVAGNLVWVLFLIFIIGAIFSFISSVYTVLFEQQLCEYFLSFGIKAKTTCFVTSIALPLLFFIFYPLLSQIMLLKASENVRNNVFLRILSKLISIASIIILFSLFGFLNFYLLLHSIH